MAVFLCLFLSRLWDYGKHLVGPGYLFKSTYDHVARPVFIVILKNILRYANHRDNWFLYYPKLEKCKTVRH